MCYRPTMGDTVAGLGLAYGIMQALYVREKTGEGQQVDLSLFHMGLYQMSFDISGALITGLDFDDWRPQPPKELKQKTMMTVIELLRSLVVENSNPLTGQYMTKDAQSLLIAILQPDRYWEKFCKITGREDLLENPKYNTTEGRNADDKILREAFTEAFMQKTFDEWVPLLEGIPYARRQTVLEAITDPQAVESGCIVTYDHPKAGPIKQLANPIMMSKTPSSVRMPAPEFGQHTEEVLLEYGYTRDDIATFQNDGTIAGYE